MWKGWFLRKHLSWAGDVRLFIIFCVPLLGPIPMTSINLSNLLKGAKSKRSHTLWYWALGHQNVTVMWYITYLVHNCDKISSRIKFTGKDFLRSMVSDMDPLSREKDDAVHA